MDNPEQPMIKKSFILALQKYQMLFATEQQNVLSSCALLRLVLQCPGLFPRAPVDGRGGKTEECVWELAEWQEKPAQREGGARPEGLTKKQRLRSPPKRE